MPLSCLLFLNFNPRSREGSDTEARRSTATTTDFNPRSREGSDGWALSALSIARNFNPRSREGSDCRRAGRTLPAPISIHAPVKGATLLGGVMDTDPRDFNPRSREGSDQPLGAS